MEKEERKGSKEMRDKISQQTRASFTLSKNIRILAIDDSPPLEDKEIGKSSFLIGVLWRDGKIEGIISTKVKWDGDDATEKILEMIKRSRFSNQIQSMFINSITVAGLNIIDISHLSKSLRIPVLAVTRHPPSVKELENAIRKLKEKNFPQPSIELKLSRLKNAGEPISIKTKPRVYIQFAGINKFEASELIKTAGLEPLRISHLISSGLSGESKGRF